MQKILDLRQRLQRVDPALLAARTGAEWVQQGEGQLGEFRLLVWDRPTRISYPEFIAVDAGSGTELSLDIQALLLYYFDKSDGAPLAGQWISFSELPDGRFYTHAFQGYTGNELVRAFQSNYENYVSAAEKLGGLRLSFSDASYAFQALPRVSLMSVFWRGDEDFPASIQILFDANAGHHLSTDVCAILGSMLVRRFMKALREQEAS